MPIYRKVTVSYWDGELAEANRGDIDAHVVAFYLMTCPATNQLGVYRLAIPTLCDHVGIDSRRASEALAKLSERGFSVYDERFRMVFVVEYARHEYGEFPNLADNRVKSLRTALPDLLAICRKSNVWQHFWARYGEPWAEVLAGCEPPEFEALPKPFRSPSGRLPDQDQDQDQEQEQEDICSEPLPRSEPVAWIPFTGKKPAARHVRTVPERARDAKPWDEVGLTAEDIAPLKEAYPGIDVNAEIRKARSWCLANGTKRKTASGVPRFLNGWMERAQNKAAGNGVRANGWQKAASALVEEVDLLYGKPKGAR